MTTTTSRPVRKPRLAKPTASANALTVTAKKQPRRLAIAFFYDEQGIVDEYMIHLVKSLQPFVEKTIFVSNGQLNRDSEVAVREAVEQMIVRENVGFDVWGYKEALESVGYEALAEYDEVILYNHTFYGPIYPFSEMFDRMDQTSCDFWGISTHKKVVPNPFTGTGVLPEHLNSHFIAVRKSLLRSSAFSDYWNKMEPINSYVESVLKHESRFTDHFRRLGYKSHSYIDAENYGSAYPVFNDIDEAIENRCPILKRRIFFHDPLYLEANAINLPRALRLIATTSDYDLSLVWKNIVRTNELRPVATNASLLSVLPDFADPTIEVKPAKIAVCAHVYYDDMITELLGFTNNIPAPYDFIATTDTPEKKANIERRLAQEKRIGRFEVRLVEQNRGRDMSSLFISCRDVVLEGGYDFICRLHTKKTPQLERAKGNLFKFHMLENLLNSPGYVFNLITVLQANPTIGLIVPPLIHISYPTMGRAWFANRGKVEEIKQLLDIKTPLDSEPTPVAAYGTMFWFRPAALKKLFMHKWKWTDFNAEPHHIDGGLSHGLERAIAYVAQDAGYMTRQVMSAAQAAHNYSFLEYKYQKIQSLIPDHYFLWQIYLLNQWSQAGHPLSVSRDGVIDYGGRQAMAGTVSGTWGEFVAATKRSVQFRAPLLVRILRPVYRSLRSLFTLGRR